MNGPARALAISFRCLRAGLSIAGLLALALPWMTLSARSRLHRLLPLLGWKLLRAGFGIRIQVHGVPAAAGTALTVSNHVSWTDIVVLGRLVDAGFVAKAEIAGWPIIGALTRHYGSLFITRESRTAAHALAAAMNRYPDGSGLILFAEGTTGLGNTLLPFRSGLFAVGERWPCVQPVTIVYRRRDGNPLSPAERRRIAWIGDDALLPHALALAASGGITVDVWFGETFAAENRKQAAEQSRRAIAERLAISSPDRR